jgi:hypothetical protein
MLLPLSLHADMSAATAISSHPEFLSATSSEISVNRGMEVMQTASLRWEIRGGFCGFFGLGMGAYRGPCTVLAQNIACSTRSIGGL